MKISHLNPSNVLKTWAVLEDADMWLFCVLFSAMLNLTSLAAWGIMHDKGVLSPIVSGVTAIYFLASLCMSWWALRFEQKMARTST